MRLASNFSYRSPVLRSESPLLDDQIRAVAPSIFAEAPHESRSQRYAYIPTATVLQELRGEGFELFMVCQTRVRHDDRRDFTKHMIRLRHVSQIDARGEANEIILLNAHDGTSSYQMFAGMFRFVCQNGLVCGDAVADVRVSHKGDVTAQVIEGAYEVLQGFEQAQASGEAMRAVTLDGGEAEVFARAALVLNMTTPPSRHRLPNRRCWPRVASTTTAPTCGVCSTAPRKTSFAAACSGVAATGAASVPAPCRTLIKDLRLNRALWLLADGLRQLKA